MSGNSGQSSHQIRTRSERVASAVFIRGTLGKTFDLIRQDLRFSLILSMLLMNFLICLIIEAWKPPFPYRLHDVPKRPIVCQTPFSVDNPEGTRNEIERVRLSVVPYYSLDSTALLPVRDSLINVVTGLIQKESFEEVSDPGNIADFFPQPVGASTEQAAAQFKTFFEALKRDYQGDNLPLFQKSLKRAMLPLEQTGFLREPPPRTSQRFSRGQINVPTSEGKYQELYVNEVLLGDGLRLKNPLEAEFPREIALPLFNWLYPRIRALPNTLTPDITKTDQEIEKAVAAVEPVLTEFSRESIIAPAEKEITPQVLSNLQTEYGKEIAGLSYSYRATRFISVYFTLVIAHFLGWVFTYRRERRKPKSFLTAMLLLSAMIATVGIGKFLISISGQGNLDLLPLLIFAQSIAIMFSWELSMILSLNIALALVLAEGTRLATLLVLFGTTVVVIEQLGRLRSRSKLVIVGFIAGIVSFAITVTAGVLDGRFIGTALWTEALLNGVWTLLAGVAMTGLLPFIERPFGILTDMSLLELGDVSHPLLQEMLRRAPATYSHSFQVGSIAEAAADAIGARGLLTRVGACFHDIGKILKPHYFAENQVAGENIHDTLDPRMSALIIVAHVKDGADLARQHRLPQPLIDLIEQHHGTSLVSYFYGLASRQNKDNPNGQGVDESTFRYPGPKPRSKEAGILMLADAAESGVRSMGDTATPGRIENMVRMITETKLKDGQFDDCGLTLHELRAVENSIINSLVAVRHHRIKYPGQEKALSAAAKTEQIPRQESQPKTGLSSAVTIKTDSTVVSDQDKIVRKG